MNLKLSLDTLLEILSNWEKDKVWISFSCDDIEYLESNIIIKGLGTYLTKDEVINEIRKYKGDGLN